MNGPGICFLPQLIEKNNQKNQTCRKMQSFSTKLQLCQQLAIPKEEIY